MLIGYFFLFFEKIEATHVSITYAYTVDSKKFNVFKEFTSINVEDIKIFGEVFINLQYRIKKDAIDRI